MKLLPYFAAVAAVLFAPAAQAQERAQPLTPALLAQIDALPIDAMCSPQGALGHAFGSTDLPPSLFTMSMPGLDDTPLPASAVGALSFQAYALRHEPMRARLAEANARIYGALVQWLLAHIDEAELPMPAPVFVRVLHALADGLTFACFLEPDQFPPEVFVAAFTALAR